MSKKINDEFLFAIQSLNRKKIEQIIQNGISINLLLPDGETYFTVLSNATKFSFNFSDFQTEDERKKLDQEELEIIEIMKLFLKHGADINLYDINSEGVCVTALWYATITGKVEMVNFLLQNGANPNINFNPTENPNVISSVLEIAYSESTLNTFGNAEKYESIIQLLEKQSAKSFLFKYFFIH